MKGYELPIIERSKELTLNELLTQEKDPCLYFRKELEKCLRSLEPNINLDHLTEQGNRVLNKIAIGLSNHAKHLYTSDMSRRISHLNTLYKRNKNYERPMNNEELKQLMHRQKPFVIDAVVEQMPSRVRFEADKLLRTIRAKQNTETRIYKDTRRSIRRKYNAPQK